MLSEGQFVIYCCVTNNHKLTILKQYTFIFFSVSVDQESGHDLVLYSGFLVVTIKESARAIALLQAQMREDLLINSHGCWHDAVPCRLLD